MISYILGPEGPPGKIGERGPQGVMGPAGKFFFWFITNPLKYHIFRTCQGTKLEQMW